MLFYNIVCISVECVSSVSFVSCIVLMFTNWTWYISIPCIILWSNDARGGMQILPLIIKPIWPELTIENWWLPWLLQFLWFHPIFCFLSRNWVCWLSRHSPTFSADWYWELKMKMQSLISISVPFSSDSIKTLLLANDFWSNWYYPKRKLK